MSKNEPEVEAVLSKLERDSFPIPMIQPTHKQVQMPPTLEVLSSTELGNHLGIWAALYGRAKFEQARCAANELSLEGKKGYLQKRKMALLDPKAKVTVERAKIESSDEQQALAERLVEVKTELKMLEALSTSYAKNFEAVSREISRREKEKQQWSRKYNDGGFTAEMDENGEEKKWTTR